MVRLEKLVTTFCLCLALGLCAGSKKAAKRAGEARGILDGVLRNALAGRPFDVTEAVNRLSALGPAAVTDHLKMILGRASASDPTAQAYASLAGTLLICLRGDSLKNPSWEFGPCFVRRAGFVFVRNGHPPLFCSGLGHPEVGRLLEEEDVGEDWAQRTWPDGGSLLQSVLKEEPPYKADRLVVSEAFGLGRCARRDTAMALNLRRSAVRSICSPDRARVLLLALGFWGGDDAEASLESVARHVLDMNASFEDTGSVLRAAAAALRVAGGEDLVEKVASRLKVKGKEKTWAFLQAAGGNALLEAALVRAGGASAATVSKIQMIGEVLDFRKHRMPSVGDAWKALKWLALAAEKGERPARKRARAVLRRVLWPKTYAFKSWIGCYSLDVLARLERDVREGRFRLVGPKDSVTSPFQVSALGPGWKDHDHALGWRFHGGKGLVHRVDVRAQYGKDLVLEIQNLGDGPVAINPLAFQYGWVMKSRAERVIVGGKDIVRRETHVQLGDVFFPFHWIVPAHLMETIPAHGVWKVRLRWVKGLKDCEYVTVGLSESVFGVDAVVPVPLLRGFSAIVATREK